MLLGGLKIQMVESSIPLFSQIVNHSCDPGSLGPLCRMKADVSI